MADIVYMAKEKWTALLDAIRSKAGKTDTLTADTAKTAVAGIKAGNTYDVSKDYAEGTKSEPVIESGITHIKDNLFSGERNIVNVTIPDTVTSIGQGAFGNCSKLALTSLPPKLVSIGSSAFYYCFKIAFTELPASVKTVGLQAFTYSGISTLTIKGPITFSQQAFSSCTSLKNFIIDYDHTNKDMCIFGTDIFSNTPIESGTGTITVPYDKWADYKNATNLTAYASVIKPGVHDLATLTINGRPKINIYAKNTLQLSITYNEYDNCPSEQKGVTYSIVSGPATVAQDGTVTVTDAAAAGDEIVVQATSTYNSSVSAQHTINVVNIAPSISIENTTQWIDSGTTENGYKVYKSDSGSYNTNNGKSTVTLTFAGCTTAVIYVKQSSEYYFDYVEVGPVDGTAIRGSSSNLFSAKGSNNTWQKVTITLPDIGTHTVQVLYSKDSSDNKDDDRGYFYIAEGECS